ncbi:MULTISPECIES: type I-E CRISPR-associated protein Cse2/CasB [unclassified Streptomyces]|uniref:type I-E CRISPR-associated protein Cse2/CasB n=1 Tax=unclassified Streptomyces TaxID=2593676 RepID=UPI00093B2D31|nr:type I-E CRISPR-associated protein Cse2/CasB [Streptomyces sp. CB01883]OKJ74427.1 CRISPR-associated protein [Streptomyces sp. CB01883]
MTTAPAPPPVRSRVADLAAAQIASWQQGYLADHSAAVAALARLRRGAGRNAAEMPDLWSLVDTGPLHERNSAYRALSEVELTRAEDALYTASTLWALHQQSRAAAMHRAHRPEQPAGLGAAVRRLMPPNDIDEPVRGRLVRAATAATPLLLAQRLRDIVVLLRRADIPLDYGLLAGQLYAWQWPGGPEAVRREWGRSFNSRPAARQPGENTPPPTAITDTESATDLKDAS